MSAVEDCGQESVCATPPGCLRHWQERCFELVHERDEARIRLGAALDALALIGGEASAALRTGEDGEP